jgi:ribonuclease P protein component
MILRQHRFHGYNSLRFVYAKGATQRSSLLAVRTVINTRRDSYRCAVVVSKKVSKSAVVRNRIRRRLYEQIRVAGIVQPADIVVTVYSEMVATMPAEQLKTTLNTLLAQAGVLE